MHLECTVLQYLNVILTEYLYGRQSQGVPTMQRTGYDSMIEGAMECRPLALGRHNLFDRGLRAHGMYRVTRGAQRLDDFSDEIRTDLVLSRYAHVGKNASISN